MRLIGPGRGVAKECRVRYSPEPDLRVMFFLGSGPPISRRAPRRPSVYLVREGDIGPEFPPTPC